MPQPIMGARHSSLLIAFLCTAAIHAAAPPTEPSPGPAWGVYLPLGATDAAGVIDATKKCHWFQKFDANGDPVGGAWYSYLVVKDGAVISDNADPAIWNGASAELYLQPRPNNPQELEPVLRGAPLTAANGYAVMRMVLVRPGVDGMPPSPAATGSPRAEPARRANEDRTDAALAAGWWVAADECSQGLWRQVMGDTHPVDPAAANHDAALAAALAADGITDLAAFGGHDRPEVYLSFDDARAFCARLAAFTGEAVRLPAEGEWEYACRGGRATAFNTERGYTLRGPQWEIADTGTPPLLVDADDYDDYFAKRKPMVNGSDGGWPDPDVLTRGMVFLAGDWEEHIRTVRFTSLGRIDATQAFTALAEVEANFDSRYRRWYAPALQLAWLPGPDGFDAWFTVEDDLSTPRIRSGPTTGGRSAGPIGPVAYDDDHLADLVQGLWVAVDAAGATTIDPLAIIDFRQVVDGILPPGVTRGTGALVYHHQAEYDQRGIYLAAPLPDEETFFQEADEDIAEAIAGLPLETPWIAGAPRSTAGQDLGERLSEAIDRAAAKPPFAHVDWGRSTYDRSFSVDLSQLQDKRGRYALRNRWGIANTHGNVAEWCVPGLDYDPARRWDGEAGYADAGGYGPGRAYVAIRGGSYRASADKCRSAARHPAIPDDRRPHIGFRFLIQGP